ncbi:MAG: ABC transporter permease subunit [Bacillota bacterium]
MMLRDVLLIVWKEWKESILQLGGLRKAGLLSTALLAVVFGIIFPFQAGSAWVQSPESLVYWAWIPLFLVTNIVTDSFAGERERRTLETLLATRLSSDAILYGKILAAVAYAGAVIGTVLILGLVTVNLLHGGDGLLMYPPAAVAIISLLTAFGGGIVATMGTMISMRTSSVRQAQQISGIGVMLLVFVPVFAVQSLPDTWRSSAVQWLSGLGGAQVWLLAVLFLVLLNGALLMVARRVFDRTAMNLD